MSLIVRVEQNLGQVARVITKMQTNHAFYCNELALPNYSEQRISTFFARVKMYLCAFKEISIQRLPNKIMHRGGRAAAPRLARCERAAASRPYWILYSLQWPYVMLLRITSLRTFSVQHNSAHQLPVVLGNQASTPRHAHIEQHATQQPPRPANRQIETEQIAANR